MKLCQAKDSGWSVRRVANFGLLTGLFGFLLLAVAPAVVRAGNLPAPIERGLAWLQAQVGPDGSLANEAASSALPHQLRSEAALALAALASMPVALNARVAANEDQSTEFLARRALVAKAGGGSDAVALAALSGLQNGDGGFAPQAGYESTALDTAWALLGLKTQESSPQTTERISKALAYLAQTRISGAAWGQPEQPQIYVTALVMLAAQDWRTTHQVTEIAGAGKDWLLTQVRTGSLGYAIDDALGLIALARQGSEAAVLQPLISALQGRQLTDGSWENDPFATALALRALWFATSGPTEPTTGAVAGKVVDDASGLPLEGVSILLRGASGDVSSTSDGAGSFRQEGLTPGAYTLELTKPGYQAATQSITVSAGVTSRLGTVRLLPAPVAATVMGTVRDLWARPIPGVLIWTGVASASSDARGAYLLQGLAPGRYTLHVTEMNHQPAVLPELPLEAGTVYLFSPTLYALNTGIPATSLRGKVVDADNKKPVAGASVSLGGSQRSTAADGSFSFASLSPGKGLLEIAAPGFLGRQAAVLLAAGTNDLGELTLSAQPANYAIVGLITDAGSGKPIVGAAVAGGGRSATSGPDGRFRLSDLTQPALTLVVSASGYVSRTESVSLAQTGETAIDFALLPLGSSGLQFQSLKPSKATYHPSDTFEIEAILANSSSAATEATVDAVVLDPKGQQILVLAANAHGQGQFPLNLPVAIPSGGTATLEFGQLLLRHGAGTYTVLARAWGMNGQAMAEATTAFDVADEAILSGGISVDPPLVQAGAGIPVQIAAQLQNLGNRPIPAGDLELSVVLEAVEPQASPSLAAEVRGLVRAPSLPRLRATTTDTAGNTYAVTGMANDGRVFKITRDGESVLIRLPEGYPQLTAVVLDGEGGLWIGTKSTSLWHIDAQGAATRSVLTQLAETSGIDRDAKGDLYLTGRKGGSERLVRRAPDGTETVLAENGFATPTTLVKNAAGELLVTNQGDGTVVRVRADGAILPFVRGLNRPMGITADAAGNFYVADSGSGAVLRITPEGQISEYARGLKQPTDLRFDAAGRLYVSCTGDHSIRRVELNGTVSLYAQGIANLPRALAYAPSGELHIANGDGSLRVLGADGLVREVAQGLATPAGLAFDPSGAALVTETAAGAVSKVAGGVSTRFAVGLDKPQGIAIGAEQVLVAEFGANRLARYNLAGVLLERVESALNSPSILVVDSADRIIVANSDRLSLIEGGKARVFHRGLGARALVPLAAGAGVYALVGYDLHQVAYDGASTKLKTLPFYAQGIALNAEGNLLLLDPAKKIHKLESSGNLVVLTSLSSAPKRIVSDEAGRVYLLGGDNALYSVAGDGTLAMVANLGLLAGGEAPSELAMGRDGHPLVSTNWGKVLSIDPLSGASTLRQRDVYPSGFTVDSQNTLYLSYNGTHEVAAFDPAGHETARFSGFIGPKELAWDGSQFWFFTVNATFTLASAPGSYPIKRAGQALRSLAAAPGGALYAAWGSTAYKWTNSGWTSAKLIPGPSSLDALAFRGDGTLALANTTESSVYLLATDWSTLAVYAGLVNPTGLAFDAAGRLYAAGKTAGVIARFPANAPPNSAPEVFARVGAPGWLAFDSAKRLWVTDGSGLRHIDEQGAVTVVASAISGVAAGVLVEDTGVVRMLNSYRHQLLRWEGGLWSVEASGLAQPEGLRAMPDGSVLVASTGNGSLVKWQNGGLDVVAAGLASPHTLLPSADGQFVWVGGDSGNLSRVDGQGQVESLEIAGFINQAALRGLALGSQGELILATDYVTGAPPSLYELKIVDRTPPPPPGTVVHRQTHAAPALASAEGETLLQFQSWTPPWGGDYKLTVQRAGIRGEANGQLHAGPFATATLATKLSRVAPKSQSVPVQMKVLGADDTSIARVELGLLKATVKLPRVQGMVADRSGTIFYTGQPDLSLPVALHATASDGQTRTVATGHTFGMGLAIDSQERLYAPVYMAATGKYRLLRFERDGSHTEIANDLAGGVGGVTVGGLAVNSRDEILVALTGKLLKVSPEGAVSVVATAGLPSPAGVVVDGKDNVYILNHTNLVTRIKADGTASAIYSQADGQLEPRFEYEGMALAGGCGENFYLAPVEWQKFGQKSVEEHTLVQISSRSGQGAVILNGLQIHYDLTDMDYLVYDRFSSRLLMWTDYSGGRIWQVPVFCGAINVETHLVTKPGQTLANANPPWAAALRQANGGTDYVWNLRDVGPEGVMVNFDTELHDLALGETRPVLDQAFLLFKNSFTNSNLAVPLAIPRVYVDDRADLGVATDQTAYPAFATAEVTTRLANPNDFPVTGDLEVSVFDASGFALATINREAVVLPPADALDVRGQFPVGTILPGLYTVKAVLSDGGQALARGSAEFRVTEDKAQGAIVGHLALDRAQYQASDRVAISSRVWNTSVNQNFDQLTLSVQVKEPGGGVVFARELPIAQLTAQASLDRVSRYTYLQAPAGDYTVTQRVLDANGLVLDERTAIYKVLSSALTASGLRGEITAHAPLVQHGQPVRLTHRVRNLGNAAFAALPLKVRVLEAQNGALRREFQEVTALAIAEERSNEVVWSTGDAPTPATARQKSYLAALVAEVDGKEVVLAQDLFAITRLAPFSFTPQFEVPRVSPRLSNAVTLEGLAGPSGISVTGGEYSLNGAAFTASPGTVNEGDELVLRQVSAGSYSTRSVATVAVAGFTASFEVTTLAQPCAAPNAFSFAPKSGERGQKVASNPVTLSGIGAGCSAQATVSGGAYKVLRLGQPITPGENGFTQGATTVQDEDELIVQVQASSQFSAKTSATLNVGGVAASFEVTTPGQTCAAPNAFSFAPKSGERGQKVASNPVTLAGMGTGCTAQATVSGGAYRVERQGTTLTPGEGGFTQQASAVQDGDQLTLRVQASSQFSTKTSATLTVGGVLASFEVSTLGPSCAAPNPFSFASKSAKPGEVVVSDTITLGGMGEGCTAEASITGGSYRILRQGNALSGGNEGYTQQKSSVQDGDQVTLKTQAPPGRGASTQVLFAAGAAQAPWVVTAEAPGDPERIPTLAPWPLGLLAVLVLVLALALLRRGAAR